MLEAILFNTLFYLMKEVMEHIITGFLEDTQLRCAGDLHEGCTQGCQQTRDQERPPVVL